MYVAGTYFGPDLGVGAISGCFWELPVVTLNGESSDGGALDRRVSLTESDATDKVERHDIPTDWIAIVTEAIVIFSLNFWPGIFCPFKRQGI